MKVKTIAYSTSQKSDQFDYQAREWRSDLVSEPDTQQAKSVGETDVKPEIEQAALSNCIEREQAERAECRVAAAKSEHQKQPASRSKIKLAGGVRDKI
jgi:hypothetical protein